jgi:hypothetical protein
VTGTRLADEFAEFGRPPPAQGDLLRSIESTNTDVLEKIRTEADYFERNAERMRYPKFRRQHLFVGSGVIEAGCKTAIGSRLKRSGMFWTVRSANSIIGPARLLPQWPIRELLGGPPGRINFHFHVAHPRVTFDQSFSGHLED